MREKEVRGLMEAYSQVHAPQELTEEQIWKEVETWVNSLVEEGHDLSDHTWEEMYEAYIEEQGRGRTTGQTSSVWRPSTTPGAGSASGQGGRRGSGSSPGGVKPSFQNTGGYGKYGAPSSQVRTPAPVAKPAAAPAAKPAAAPAAKPAAKPTTTAPKTTTPAAPTKPAGSAMDQWAKANPKLAAAKAERDRTRGTSATTNPLMKDMKSSMPAPTKKGTNLAAGVDLFDIVKGYLLDEGYAESEDAAMVIMVNMSEEWRESILESCGVELDEEITSKKGKAKAAEMIAARSTPSGRAKKGQGDNVAQIKHIGRASVDGYGGTPPNRKVAKNPVKSNFTGLKGGTGNKAARRAASLKNEEYMDEAQAARENPEDHDKEEKKKYEPVRGEKTPMPPRGDKRREDFEKWYAKNVR